MWHQEILVCISLSAWAAITKYHTLGGLNNRCLFFAVLEAVKFQIKVPALIFMRRFFMRTLFLAYTQLPHCVFMWNGEDGGENRLCLYFPSYQETNMSWRTHTHYLI